RPDRRTAGEAVPGLHPGRFPDRAPLRRGGGRPCPLPPARAHDGRGRDRDERAGEKGGVSGGAAGGRGSIIQAPTPPDCCARAASGHAAAPPPSSVMKLRLVPWCMGSSPEPAVPAYHGQAAAEAPAGLGLSLNRSELSRSLISQGFSPKGDTNRRFRRTL